MSYNNVKDSRKRLKERLTYIMGNKCAICNYDKCISALEFHHLNPEEKDFALGTNANISYEKARQEVKKCILVCANCHREIHAGLIENGSLSSSYNEEKAEEISQLVENIKHKKI